MSKTEPGKLVNGNESSILIKNKYLIKETTIFLSFPSKTGLKKHLKEIQSSKDR